MSRYSIALGKEDFKFSCAHFTLFGPDVAERLHGHNYQVRVEVGGDTLDALGVLVDFARVKEVIRRLCAELDSLTLIPAQSKLLRVNEGVDDVEVLYHDRRYVFPRKDVVILPLVNTTVELFAEMFWRRLARELSTTLVNTLSVEVGETAGQSCIYRAALPG